MKILKCIFLLIFISNIAAAQLLQLNSELYVSPGATLVVEGSTSIGTTGTLQNNGEVIIKGNLINDGIINDITAGKYILMGNGSATSIGGANPIRMYDLELDNPANFNISIPLRVNSELEFTNGYANYTAAGPFVFGPSATATNESDTRHIIGSVSKEGILDFTFPIGTGSKLKRVAVSNITGGNSATTFIAQYVPALPNFHTSFLSPLIDVSDIEYWNINRTGSTQAEISVEFTPTDYPSATGNETTLRLAQLNASDQWQAIGSYENSVYPSLVSSALVTDFLNEFTIGSIVGGTVPLHNITLFARKLNDYSAELSWEVEGDFSDISSANLQRETGNGWINLTGISMIHLQDRFVDNTIRNGINYYRINAMAYNGNLKYSNVASVHSEGKGLITVYPTLATSSITVNSQGEIKLHSFIINDARGRNVISRSLNNSTSNIIDVSSLVAGTYFLVLQTSTGVKSFVFVKGK